MAQITTRPTEAPAGTANGTAGTTPSFVVALPDTDAVARLATRLNVVSDVRLTHRSGRPWLLGNVTVGRIVVGVAGERSVAVVGESDADDDLVERLAASSRTADDLVARVHEQVHGSYLVLASFSGRVHAAGPALQTRRVFTGRVDGTWIAADRADVLADLTGAELDPGSLALRLAGALPHPLDDVVPWRGIDALPGHELLTIDADGRGRRTTRWWSVPEPTLSVADGATGFREALEKAVDARTADGRGVACDLSGGLDSTPICHAAAQGPRGVLARTLYNDDPGGDEDLRWARLAIETMPGVHTHLVASTDDFEDFYEGVDGVEEMLDDPTQAATAAPRILRMLRDDVDRDISVHLNGLGGDHLLRGLPAWEHTLVRSRPWTAWTRARSEHVPYGVSPFTTLRQLADRRHYGRWFQEVVADALAGAPTPETPQVNDWSGRPTLSPWLSDDARTLVGAAAAAADTDPLHPTIAGHTDVFYVRDAARLVRSTAQLGHRHGVAYEAPLLDDHVVEAALAVRRDERDTPLEWKPLMKAAMRGVLPDAYLRRTNKVGGGPQSVRGYSRHHARLVGLMDEAGVLDSDLVDRDALLASTAPQDRETPPGHVHHAVNVAVFLRNRRPVVPPA